MSEILVPGAFNSTERGPFNLREGQIRGAEVVHNGGWYNKDGQKIGWGDLSGEDMVRIRDEIPEGEVFIILREHDSYWSFKGDREKEMNPGLKYILQKVLYIIRRGTIFAIDDYTKEESVEVSRGMAKGPMATVRKRSKADELIPGCPSGLVGFLTRLIQ